MIFTANYRHRFCTTVLIAFVALLEFAVPAHAASVSLSRDGGDWILQNDKLRIRIDPVEGRITVLDRGSGHIWRQAGAAPSAASVTIPQVANAPDLDDNFARWQIGSPIRLTSRMTTDMTEAGFNKNLGAEVWTAWDTSNFYLAARVHDSAPEFGDPGLAQWWEKDSLEFWVNGRQFGLNLNPAGSKLLTSDGQALDARVFVRRSADGYTVTSAIPWHTIGELPGGKVGSSGRFAVGVNDTDGHGHRVAQLYYPVGWVHSQPSTFATALLTDAQGHASALPAAQSRFQSIRPLSSGAGLQFEYGGSTTRGVPSALMSISLAAGSSDMLVTTDVADRTSKSQDVVTPDSFVLDSKSGVLAVTDYCDGHLYPLDVQPFPLKGSDGARLDMPWIGLCDLDAGYGYSIILDTSDDSTVRYNSCQVDGRSLIVPQVVWKPSMGAFSYARRVIYHFVSNGGYVALARAYRDYADHHGLIVPFTRKIKRNPNIARLFGAPDMWGNSSLDFALQAKTAGVDKMLIHGKSSAAEMQTIDDLGYLTSNYDNYTDTVPIDAAHPLDSSHEVLPDHIVMKSDGARMTAWLTWDKKLQYMKRCPTFWVPAAKAVVPSLLETYPYLGRFIDVTTAEGLYECYDPAHPMTRSQKRQCGIDLTGYMSSQNLVVGGEHGIWWCPQHEDYVEGMMSGNRTSWPAGYLIRPKTKDDPFTWPQGSKLPPWSEYEQISMGHKWRAPLWELVFHDCIVTTWYWGDASDYLLTAAPEITPKKDAFNVLYGTIPLMWAVKEGAWFRDRKTFLRTYRNTCKMHEAVALAQMVDHRFLTPDHDVQASQFSDGTRTIVNFGESVYKATLDKQTCLLPQTGWIAVGPKIRQSLELMGGKPVTTIEAPGYRFSDATGTDITLRQEGRDRIIANIGGAAGSTRINLRTAQSDWDARTTQAFLLDVKGHRTSPLALAVSQQGEAILPAASEAQAYEIVCRSGGAKPFLP